MNLKQVMAELKKKGSALYQKTWPRHGIRQPFFGVKYSDLYALQKKLAGEHELALELWDTGNHDARILATLIVDPMALTSKQLDAWVKVATNTILNDAVAVVVAKSAHAKKKAEAWTKVKAEWKSAAGWNVVGALAAEDSGVPDAWLARKLEEIEAGVDAAANRTRHCMNQALICIGGYRSALRDDVYAAVKRIGKIEVDHGDTSCKTPDPIPYIKKMVARGKKTKTKKTTRKKRTGRKTASSRRAR